MSMPRIRPALLLLLGLATAPQAHAQMPPDPAPLLAAQRAAMQRLARMDGLWRGSATMWLPGGNKHTLTQTERVGPALDSTLRMVEGRGYNAAGAAEFHALGLISYDPAKQRYSMRSYARGQSGDFELTPTDSGFVWTIPAGPMTIRYTATLREGRWHEIGVRELPGQPAVPFIELDLRRIGDTDWPAAGAVPPR
jgi:hypothetical protein